MLTPEKPTEVIDDYYTRAQWERDRAALEPLVLYRTLDEWAKEAKPMWLRGLFPTPGQLTLTKGSQQILSGVTPTNPNVRKAVMGSETKPIEFNERTWDKFYNNVLVPQRAKIESDRTVEGDGKTPRGVWQMRDDGKWFAEVNEDGTRKIAPNKGMYISVTCLRPGLKIHFDNQKKKRVTIALDNDVKEPRGIAEKVALGLKEIMQTGQSNQHHNCRTSCPDHDDLGGLMWCQIDEDIKIPEWLNHSKLSQKEADTPERRNYNALPLDVLTEKGTVFVGMHRKTGKLYRNTGKFNPTNFNTRNLPVLNKARLWLISHLYQRPEFITKYTTKVKLDDKEHEFTPEFVVDRLSKMTAGQDRDNTCMRMLIYFYKLQHRGLKLDRDDAVGVMLYFSELCYKKAGMEEKWTPTKIDTERAALRRQWGGIKNVKPLPPESDDEDELSPLEHEILIWRGEEAEQKAIAPEFKIMVKFLMDEDERRGTNLVGEEKRNNFMFIDTLRHYQDGWWQPISIDTLRVDLNKGYSPDAINRAITLICDQARNSDISRLMSFAYNRRKDSEEAQETLMQICCTNGTIQLNNKGEAKIVGHDPKHGVVNGAPFEYTPFETNKKPGQEGYLEEVYELYKGLCPYTIQHLDFMLPEVEDRYAALMYEGLCHFPITRFEKSLELTGRGGTGKTVWTERLANLFTSNNTKDDVISGRKEIQKFSRCSIDSVCDGFNRAIIRGRLLHISDDVGSALNSKGTEFWRSMVSGVSMNMRDIYEKASDSPTPIFARLWLNSNQSVQFYGTDADAIRRRRLILHVNEISRSELPDGDPNKKDTNAGAKLATRKELQASFNLAIQMFQHVLALNDFPMSDMQKDRASSEAKYDNLFEAFAVFENHDIQILNEEQRKGYKNWCYFDDLLVLFRGWANEEGSKHDLSERQKSRLLGQQGKHLRETLKDWARLNRAGDIVKRVNIPTELDARPIDQKRSRQKAWIIAISSKHNLLPSLLEKVEPKAKAKKERKVEKDDNIPF